MSRCESIVLIGWGAIGHRVAALLAERGGSARIVAVAVHDPDIVREGLPEGAALISAPEALAGISATLAVEAAGRSSVMAWGQAALGAGMDFAVSSTSAFVVPGALEALTDLAAAQGRQVLIPPGALGGIDALASASRLGLSRVEHRIIKPSGSWVGTRAEALCDLMTLTAPFTFFQGAARDAADAFPQNANVAVISSLAGLGLEKTHVALVADPAAKLNRHEIRAVGDFGELEIVLSNRPLANNLKSSEMTALNLVRLIENRTASLVL